MDRRGFLKVLGAMAAGAGLRAVPVLGETYSELVVPQSFLSVAPVKSGLTMVTDPDWVPVTTRMLNDENFLRGFIGERLMRGLDLAADRAVFKL